MPVQFASRSRMPCGRRPIPGCSGRVRGSLHDHDWYTAGAAERQSSVRAFRSEPGLPERLRTAADAMDSAIGHWGRDVAEVGQRTLATNLATCRIWRAFAATVSEPKAQ